MVTLIPHALDSKALTEAHRLLSSGKFVDGKLSAGKEARGVKHNEELAPDTKSLDQLNNLVMGSLVQNQTYQNAALPLRVAAPYYARYAKGMSYGEHIDDPIMGTTNRYRSDIAITIFLSDPTSYDGGELAIRTEFGEQKIKMAAGDAVLYPASSLHQVKEVTEGVRLVAVSWAQSLVRDAAQRELLYELSLARDALLANPADNDATALISKSYVNLLRMWSEV